jgi:Trypsin-like peptidase domain
VHAYGAVLTFEEEPLELRITLLEAEMNKRATAIQDKITRVPVRLELCFGDTVLGSATAFFAKGAKGEQLVTNWHVVSGRHPSTLKPLHPKSALPNILRIYAPMNQGTGNTMVVHWRVFNVALYKDADCLQPSWLVHPTYRQGVDIAALPVERGSDTILLDAEDKQLDLDDLRLRPSMDVYIVGYPRGMVGGANFPIWKRGSIASEPEFDIDGKPMFYIDAATREGLSGAPVYAEEVGYWAPKGATEPSQYQIGRGRAFVGVYASRIGAEDEFKAQLGMVWKASALKEILDFGAPGDSSFLMHGSV